jgi:hypothetical protein
VSAAEPSAGLRIVRGVRSTVLILAVAALAGCAGGDDDETRVSSPAAMADPCLLVTTGEMEDILDSPVSAARKRLDVRARFSKPSCWYVDEEAPGEQLKAALVAVPAGEAKRALAKKRGQLLSGGGVDLELPPVEPVAGLGDEAFVDLAQGFTLFVRQRRLMLAIDVLVPARQDEGTRIDTLGKAREIARRALERLEPPDSG